MEIKDIPIPTMPDWLKLYNTYDPEYYAPGKRVSAEEWNTLFLASVRQGNYNADTLELLIKTYLPETYLTQMDFNKFSTQLRADFTDVTNEVNSLGERVVKAEDVVYSLNDIIQEANRYAKQADTKADEAVTFAQSAVDTVDTAVDAASTAVSISEEANSTAHTALSNSQDAINTSTEAKAQSTQAISTAGSASLRAEDAIATANAAKVESASAKDTALQAESTAVIANDTSANANATASDAKNIAQDALNRVLEGVGTQVLVDGEFTPTFDATDLLYNPGAGSSVRVVIINPTGTTGTRSVSSTSSNCLLLRPSTGRLYTPAPVNDTDAANKVYVDTKIATLIGTAPETLDTLEEIAKAIEENEGGLEALNALIANTTSTIIRRWE